MPPFLTQSGSSCLIPTKSFKTVVGCLIPDDFWNNKDISKDWEKKGQEKSKSGKWMLG